MLRELRFPTKTNLKEKKIGHSLIYLLKVFDYMFENSFGVRFHWTAGFVFWILGCLFWVMNVGFISSDFILASIIFCMVSVLAIFDLNFDKVTFVSEPKVGFSVYALLISLSVLSMVISKSIATGVTTFIVLVVGIVGLIVMKQREEAT